MQKIVVTGGTGFVGRPVCEQLAARWPAARLVVPTRRRASGKALAVVPNVDLVEADVHDPATQARLLDGADALVHLVAILHGSAADFERVHVRLPQTLAAAAGAAGVRRVVHVSALGVSPQAPSDYLRSKAAGEAVWQHAAAEHGFALALLRPSVIFGADDRFTNLFAALQRVFPLLPLAGADARFQPVAVGDVAAAVRACLAATPMPGPVIECAGPEVLTLAQIVRRVGAMAGCARPVLPLPAWPGRLQAAAMALLPGEPLVSADNLRSMQVPNIATGDAPGLAALGITPAPLATLAGHFRPRDPRAR